MAEEETKSEETAPAPLVPPEAAAAAVDATATEPPAPAPKKAKPSTPSNAAPFFWGVGRRKTSVARVRVREGSGELKINGRSVDKYFTELRDQNSVVQPLKVTSCEERFDVFVNVSGGGYAGQAGAVVLGISRALRAADSSLYEPLKDNDLLTRDARMVERKKYGQRGARRRFQFSKR